MANINSNISIITLNVNGLNNPIQKAEIVRSVLIWAVSYDSPNNIFHLAPMPLVSRIHVGIPVLIISC